MHLKRVLFVALLGIGAAGSVAAQQPQVEVSRTPVSVDVSRLPIDLEKVIRQMRQAESTQTNGGLHIRYTVDVYGSAPRIEFFTKQDNLATGPVPYGAPTHRQMIDQVTPIEFRAPIMDFSALLRWLADRSKK